MVLQSVVRWSRSGHGSLVNWSSDLLLVDLQLVDLLLSGFRATRPGRSPPTSRWLRILEVSFFLRFFKTDPQPSKNRLWTGLGTNLGPK